MHVTGFTVINRSETLKSCFFKAFIWKQLDKNSDNKSSHSDKKTSEMVFKYQRRAMDKLSAKFNDQKLDNNCQSLDYKKHDVVEKAFKYVNFGPL